MKHFKIGAEYEATDPCGYNIKIVSRSAKYLTVTNGSETWRMKIRHDEDGNEMLIASTVPESARDMYTFNATWEANAVYIGRKSRYTGRVEYKDTKCGNSWCTGLYVEKYPDRVWKFSKSGAKKIIQRYESYGWNWDYFVVPVDEFEG